MHTFFLTGNLHCYKLVFIFILPFFLTSCRSGRNVVYFSTIVKDTVYSNHQVNTEYIIRPNDLLNISCATMDEEMFKILNISNTMGGNGTTTSSVVNTAAASLTLSNGGYLVDREGFISYPFLDRIKVAGLTQNALVDSLKKRFEEKQLLQDAVFDVRVQNYRVTVLGEVTRPSVIIVPNEKISLPEALGMAGDLTIYGKRENVLLVREQDGQRIFKHINLNTDSLFTSDYYYLKANDLVYVEPINAKKINATGIPIILPLVLSALTFFVTIFNYLK